MRVVVDTNVVFSGLLSPIGTISDILLNSQGVFHFFAPHCILEELDRHWEKLIRLSGLTHTELKALERIMMKKIDVIDLDAIRKEVWEKAFLLTANVDEFDAPFVALSLELQAILWTGDKKLVAGLMLQNVDWALNTSEMRTLRNSILE